MPWIWVMKRKSVSISVEILSHFDKDGLVLIPSVKVRVQLHLEMNGWHSSKSTQHFSIVAGAASMCTVVLSTCVHERCSCY